MKKLLSFVILESYWNQYSYVHMFRDGISVKDIQKLSFANILHKKCSKKFRKFHWKTPMLECLFLKVAGCKFSINFTKMRLQHRCFPVKFAKLLETPIFYRTPRVTASGYFSD